MNTGQATANAHSYELPPFPAIATKLVDELNRDETDVPKVVHLIECEPAINAKILKLANSPIYGVSRQITSTSHCVVILGFRSVSQLALTVATCDLFSDETGASQEIRQQTFHRSLAVATVAKAICQEHRYGNADEAFLCGVMHDVGKLVLLNEHAEQYTQLLESVEGGNSIELENEAFQINHAQLGHHCCNEWQLPAVINHAILNHHEPISALTDPLPIAIASADYLARKWQIGHGEPDSVELSEEDLAIIESTFPSDLQEQCQEQFDAIMEICTA